MYTAKRVARLLTPGSDSFASRQELRDHADPNIASVPGGVFQLTGLTDTIAANAAVSSFGLLIHVVLLLLPAPNTLSDLPALVASPSREWRAPRRNQSKSLSVKASRPL